VLELNSIARLLEQLLGLLYHAKLSKAGVTQGTELYYNIEQFCEEPLRMILFRRVLAYASLGASVEFFFLITWSVCYFVKVLWKY